MNPAMSLTPWFALKTLEGPVSTHDTSNKYVFLLSFNQMLCWQTTFLFISIEDSSAAEETVYSEVKLDKAPGNNVVCIFFI